MPFERNRYDDGRRQRVSHQIVFCFKRWMANTSEQPTNIRILRQILTGRGRSHVFVY